jgi:hypothetical protein
MTSSTRIQLLSFAAASALLALTAASVPARSDERPVRLGLVGPLEPIMTTVGNEYVIAFYRPDSGDCNLYVVLSDRRDVSGDSTAQVRISLSPRQIVHLDTSDNDTLNLKCADDAESLAVVDEDEHVIFGSSISRASRASATTF